LLNIKRPYRIVCSSRGSIVYLSDVGGSDER
jgi:hypothetical protein